jgi:cystathionine gamma-synthase
LICFFIINANIGVFMTRKKDIGQSTMSIWGGEQEHELYERSTQVPVVHSVSFGYKDIDTWHKASLGLVDGHIYSRNTNPTVRAFEDKCKELENAEAATSFASGMAAISNTLGTFLKSGDRVVSIKDSYGGTNVIFNEFLPPLNIDVSLCETSDHEQIMNEIAKGCQVLYLETPTNPTIKITNIKKLSAAAKEVGAIVVVDNTFATPINQNPLALGADIVLHSASKYLGGHADALGGVICGAKKLIDKVYHYREINGATLAPMDAYSLLRGMKTLKLRVQKQNESAMIIAKHLQKHPLIEQVNYPGLETHLGHEIAKEQMPGGYGGMLSFAVKGGLDSIKKFLPKLKYAHMAANLGCVETVVGPPSTTSHVECSANERAAAGIPEGLVRYSTGIEDVEDLIDDLDNALNYLT